MVGGPRVSLTRLTQGTFLPMTEQPSQMAATWMCHVVASHLPRDSDAARWTCHRVGCQWRGGHACLLAGHQRGEAAMQSCRCAMWQGASGGEVAKESIWPCLGRGLTHVSSGVQTNILDSHSSRSQCLHFKMQKPPNTHPSQTMP